MLWGNVWSFKCASENLKPCFSLEHLTFLSGIAIEILRNCALFQTYFGTQLLWIITSTHIPEFYVQSLQEPRCASWRLSIHATAATSARTAVLPNPMRNLLGRCFYTLDLLPQQCCEHIVGGLFGPTTELPTNWMVSYTKLISIKGNQNKIFTLDLHGSIFSVETFLHSMQSLPDDLKLRSQSAQSGPVRPHFGWS